MSGVTLGNDIPRVYFPTETAPCGVHYVAAPNGRTVPVGLTVFETQRSDDPGSDYHRITDTRDIVSTPQRSLRQTYNSFPFSHRALEGINYSNYGFTKIGNVWVDPQNREDVDFATDLATPKMKKIRTLLTIMQSGGLRNLILVIKEKMKSQ